MSDVVAERLHQRTMRRVIGALAALAVAGALAAGVSAPRVSVPIASSVRVAAAVSSPTAAVSGTASALEGVRRFVSSLETSQLAALAGPTGAGVRLADLGAEQRAAVLGLLDSLLSPEARGLFAEAMAADDALASAGSGAGSGDYRIGWIASADGGFLQFAGPQLAVNAILRGDTVRVEPELVAV